MCYESQGTGSFFPIAKVSAKPVRMHTSSLT